MHDIKAEDKSEPNNYRPISLLSNFHRIFEKMVYTRMKSFLNENIYIYIIPPDKGFVKNTHLNTQLLTL